MAKPNIDTSSIAEAIQAGIWCFPNYSIFHEREEFLMSKDYKYRKWFTFEGRQYSVRGDTLDEVYEKKAKKLQELKETGRIVSGDTLLKDWAIQCIETYKVNQKEITRQKYISRIRHCILEEIGDLPLKKIKKPLSIETQRFASGCGERI